VPKKIVAPKIRWKAPINRRNLMAAAARALHSYPRVNRVFAPFVVRALTNIVGHDDPVSLEQYGQYLLSTDSGTSPIRELLDTLRWLGGAAIDALPQIEAARTSAFPAELLGNLNQDHRCDPRGS
jgi:hypothetical protein